MAEFADLEVRSTTSKKVDCLIELTKQGKISWREYGEHGVRAHTDQYRIDLYFDTDSNIFHCQMDFYEKFMAAFSFDDSKPLRSAVLDSLSTWTPDESFLEFLIEELKVGRSLQV